MGRCVNNGRERTDVAALIKGAEALVAGWGIGERKDGEIAGGKRRGVDLLRTSLTANGTYERGYQSHNVPEIKVYLNFF